MKRSWLSSSGRCFLGVCLASLVTAVGATRANAQEGQGIYITQASAGLSKLVDAGNKAGYILQNNSFSMGGGWLKQSQANWVPLYTVQLTAGQKYRFLAAGDADAKDVDLEVQDANGKSVAGDALDDSTAVVDFTPQVSGRYLVRIRLFDSRNNLPCVCVAVVMSSK